MNLPAGLLDRNYEFFTHEGVQAYCLTHGRVIPFDQWDESLLALIEKEMLLFPVKLYHIGKMGIIGRLEVIKQFVICNYGGFDHKADMINGRLQETEYWPCPQRGICQFEGKICDCLKTDTGNFLTPRETHVVKLVAGGMLDKHIAQHLDISLSTVTTHTRNIRNKTGLFRKADITRFAHQNSLMA